MVVIWIRLGHQRREIRFWVVKDGVAASLALDSQSTEQRLLHLSSRSNAQPPKVGHTMRKDFAAI